jgi:hypothetical protein
MRTKLIALLCATLLSVSASANDCACPTVKAYGKGNTSCSASESDGRCTIDYNLFTPAAEQKAAELLGAASSSRIQAPPPGASVQALMELSLGGETLLVDAVLVYLMVATADRVLDSDTADISGAARDVVRIVTPFRAQIANAFSAAGTRQWLGTPDEKLRGVSPPAEASSFSDNQLTLAPGCMEVRTTSFWAMFKASWSPMRFTPRCGR